MSAADYLPDRLSLAGLKRAAEGCRGCHLWRDATQTVFGEGLVRSRLMLVGEQPGDEEDLRGRPFVGPSGRLLRAAMEGAGIAADDAYVTNVVKHFKFERGGKRRLHQTPDRTEVVSCIPWLEAELSVVRPRVLVCLGATAARALIGPDFRVTRDRGRWVDSDRAPYVTGTVHPSAVLRSPDPAARRRAKARFIEDLERVREALDAA